MVENEKHLDQAYMDDSLSSRSDSVNISASAQEQELHNFCKQKLKNRLYVGHYKERRYVDSLATYRDLVVIHDSEVDLKKDLDIIKDRIHKFYSNSVWIGCTGPQLDGTIDNHAVWVKLHDVPFGHYWFRIKQIIFRDREIRARVEVIRPLVMSDTAVNREVKPAISTSKLETSRSKSSTKLSASKESLETDWSDSVPTLEECAYSLAGWKDAFVEKAAYLFVTFATFHNLKESSRFLVVLAVAAVTGLMQIIRFLGDFTIKFMREFSVIIKALTPITLGIIDFFTKMVGGFYILIAMLWRGNQPPSTQFNEPRYNMRQPLQIESSYSRAKARAKARPNLKQHSNSVH